LIFTVLWLINELLSSKIDDNVFFSKQGMVSNTVSGKKKTLKRHLIFDVILKTIEEKSMFRLRSRFKTSWIRNNTVSSANFPDPAHQSLIDPPDLDPHGVGGGEEGSIAYLQLKTRRKMAPVETKEKESRIRIPNVFCRTRNGLNNEMKNI
jgi:hypothetical protein